MARNVLIGVGGSGQHVVLAYLRLLSLVLPPADAVPHIFILDADAERGADTKKRSRLVDDMAALLEALLRGEHKGGAPRFEVIKPYRPGPPGRRMTIAQLVGDSTQARRLANGFLADDEGNWGSDWSVQLEHGMMANPKIGAIALAHKVLGVDVEGHETPSGPGMDNEMAQLFACLGEQVRVAIVGSSFGGTGSGAIPALVRVLDKQRVTHVRAFLTQPWFSIEQAAEHDREASAAAVRDGTDPQERNSSLGLHTYYDDLCALRAERGGAGLQRSSYVLCQSMDEWPRVMRRDQGNFDQEENPHVLNLAQATAIQAYFGLGAGDQDGPRQVMFALRSTDGAERVGQFDARLSPHLRMWIEPNDSRQLFDMVADAEATAMVLESAGRVLARTKKGKQTLSVIKDELPSRSGMKDYVEALREAMGAKTADQSSVWDRLSGHSSLMPEDSVFHELGQALLDRASDLRQSLLWIDQHAVTSAGTEQGRASGITHLPAGHLFRSNRAGEIRAGTSPIDDKAALAVVWKGLNVKVNSASGSSMAKSEVEPQSHEVFTQLFKDGEADDSLVAQFKRALAQDRTTGKAALAATVLAMAAHRSVVALRQGRLTDRSSDADQRSTSRRNDGSAGPMLRLRVAANDVADVRLTAIDITKPQVGADPPNVFDTRHPRSLKYLDPYSEFAAARTDAVSFAQAALPEHGLRGIPSLIAPILLQRWRADLGRPDRKSALREALRADDGRGGRRATLAGIYLHACRVNEAALWLLVSADPRVKFVPDLMLDDDSLEVFPALVRHSLDQIGLSRLPALLFENKEARTELAVPAFLWAGDTWCLAANRRARTFFARLLAELPSVRHAFQPDAPLLRLKQARPEAPNALDRFFVGELRALKEQFSQLAVPETEDIFCQLIDTTLDDLPDAGRDDPAPVRGPVGRRMANRALVAPLPIAGKGRPETVGVHAPVVLANLSDYLLGDEASPVIVVTSQLAGGPGTEAQLGDSQLMLPVRGDIWSELESSGNALRVKKTASKTSGRKDLARCKVQEITLQLAGLGPWTIGHPFGERALPLVERELDWAYSVWPPFTAPGWAYYVVCAQCIGSEVSDGPAQWRYPDTDLSFVVYGYLPAADSGKIVVLATIERGLPVRVHGVPAAIELRLGGQIIGSQPVLLRPQGARGRALERIGIDFGTSNTCMAYQRLSGGASDGGSDMVPLLPLSEQEIFFATSRSDTGNARSAFLATVGNCFVARSAIPTGDEPAVTLPSELLVGLNDAVEAATRQREQLGRIYATAAKAFVDIATQREIDGYPLASPLFAPLPNRRHGLNSEGQVIAWLANMVRVKRENRVYGDLKWPQGGDDNLEISRQLRALYLEAVIVAAFAHLRDNGYDRFKTFVATQPEARTSVKDAFPNGYGRDLTRVVRELCARTGLRWGNEPQEPIIVSETAAALLMNNLEDPRQPHSALTIDIGGGTTDVGVLLNDGQTLPRGAPDPRRFTSSARFAGNQLLKALVALPMVRESMFPDAGARDKYEEAALVAMLKAKLRNRISISHDERVQAVSEMFFDAAFEYALRVLALFAQTKPGWTEAFEQSGDECRLKVILLGNGFKLFDSLRVGGGGERELQDFLRSRLQRAVAAGMFSERMAAKFDFRLAPNSKSSLVSVGAFNAVEFGEGRFQPGLTDVLVPACLVTTDAGPHAQPAACARRVNIDVFGEEWLNRPPGGVPRNGLELKADADTLRWLFPLTLRHWGPNVSAVEMVREVFRSYASVAEQYLDIGALYLTGHVHDAKSFAWLLRQAG